MPDLEGPDATIAPEVPTTTYGALREGEMYHLAPTSARAAIARHGLDFSTAPGLGSAFPEGRGNYFWDSYAGVVRYQQFWAGRQFDLYKVNLKDLDLLPDPLDVAGAHFTKSHVEPSRLVRVLLQPRP